MDNYYQKNDLFYKKYTELKGQNKDADYYNTYLSNSGSGGGIFRLLIMWLQSLHQFNCLQ